MDMFKEDYRLQNRFVLFSMSSKLECCIFRKYRMLVIFISLGTVWVETIRRGRILYKMDMFGDMAFYF